VLIIEAESKVTKKQANERAKWEGKIRKARSERFSITVQGWYAAPGILWKEGTTVPVESPTAGLRGPMVISELRFVLDEAGSFTEITVARPDAFLPVDASERSWKK
jgi:prophage tail gpP-like protein